MVTKCQKNCFDLTVKAKRWDMQCAHRELAPQHFDTTVLPSRLNLSNFFDILLPLAKWNMIICLLRTFLENALKKQNFPFSPLSLHCACISVGNSVFFFFKLAAPLHVLFFKVARSPFKQKYGTLTSLIIDSL